MSSKGDNAFIYFLKTTMSSKGDGAFIYILKTTMSLVIYALKRRQCLHLHFEDDNVFSHLCFQKATMPSVTFQNVTMPSYTLSKTTMSSSQILQCLLSLCFIGLNILCFYAFENKNYIYKEKK